MTWLKDDAQMAPGGDRSDGVVARRRPPPSSTRRCSRSSCPISCKWRDPTGAAGVNQAILHGDPTKPGLYVVLNRFKPGNFSRPHFHPNDRFITVVKGTWWVATGNKFDPALSVAMPAGSFVTHFAKEVHWDGAKDEEAWVLIVGEGPATLTRVEEAK